jgi:hypothetical protein
MDYPYRKRIAGPRDLARFDALGHFHYPTNTGSETFRDTDYDASHSTSAFSEQATNSCDAQTTSKLATHSRDTHTTNRRRGAAIFKMRSMQAPTEIDTAVWPQVDDLPSSFDTHRTTVEVQNHPGRTLDLVDLGVVRKRYDEWRQQY